MTKYHASMIQLNNVMTTFIPYESIVLRKLIQTTLQPLNLWSANVEELLLATCAQESLFGTFRTQGANGPARGIFQMEKEDHDDIWTNFLKYKPTFADDAQHLSSTHTVDDLINNDGYAVFMARIHYLRSPGALPDSTNLKALWNYYKLHYNTPKGAATQKEFNQHYTRYVTDGKAT